MTNSKSTDVKATPTRRNSSDANDFYETMPLTTMPHAIYRDDAIADEHSSNEEAELASRLTAITTLVAIALIGLLIIVLAAYGLSTINDSVAPSGL